MAPAHLQGALSNIHMAPGHLQGALSQPQARRRALRVSLGSTRPTTLAARRVRHTKTDDNVLLLKTNMGAGHGGQSGRFTALQELAEEYAFFLVHLNE